MQTIYLKHSVKWFINQSAKGWVIVKYCVDGVFRWFLYDDEHELEKAYVLAMIEGKSFIQIGEPFGERQLIPIEIVSEIKVKKLEPIVKDVDCLYTMRIVIWSYYRKLVLQYDKPKYIKLYAEELKLKLSILGVQELYYQIVNQN